MDENKIPEDEFQFSEEKPPDTSVFAPKKRKVTFGRPNLRNILIIAAIIIFGLALYKFTGLFLKGKARKAKKPTLVQRQLQAQPTAAPPQVGVSPVQPQGPSQVGIPPVQPQGPSQVGVSPVQPQGPSQVGVSPVQPQGPPQMQPGVGAVEPLKGQLGEVQPYAPGGAQPMNQIQQQMSNLAGTVSSMQNTLNNVNQTLNSITSNLQRQQEQIESLKTKKMISVREQCKSIVRVLPLVPPPPIYFIQAMIPGRAWLLTPDGNTVTVTFGDVLPGYGIVRIIDPPRGIIITSTNAIIRYRD